MPFWLDVDEDISSYYHNEQEQQYSILACVRWVLPTYQAITYFDNVRFNPDFQSLEEAKLFLEEQYQIYILKNL